jgi:hypothetical protein
MNRRTADLQLEAKARGLDVSTKVSHLATAIVVSVT